MFVAWSLCAKDMRKQEPAVCHSTLSRDPGSVSAVTLSPYIPIDVTSNVQQQMVNNSPLRAHFCLCWCQCFWSINHRGVFQQEYCFNCCSGTTRSMHYFLVFNTIYELFTFILSTSNIFPSLLCSCSSLLSHSSSSLKDSLVSISINSL